MRQILAILYESSGLANRNTRKIQRKLKELQHALDSRISRIPATTDEPGQLNPAAANGTFENNSTLNKWARLLLSGLIDRRWAILYHPMLNAVHTPIWAKIRLSLALPLLLISHEKKD